MFKLQASFTFGHICHTHKQCGTEHVAGSKNLIQQKLPISNKSFAISKDDIFPITNNVNTLQSTCLHPQLHVCRRHAFYFHLAILPFMSLQILSHSEVFKEKYPVKRLITATCLFAVFYICILNIILESNVNPI